MTTEDDFQKLLDANPNDHQTRLIFADWLQDRDDPRADGYRALGVLQKTPDRFNKTQHGFHSRDNYPTGSEYLCLPHDWWKLLDPIGRIEDVRTRSTEDINRLDSRRRAEDAAALAFAKLPPERQAALLAGKA